MKNALLLAALLLILPSVTLAHPGRTDSSGCHTCKTNCPNWGLDYGEYHCHNAKATPQPIEPIKSTYGEQGTGYTTPAPEYKNNQTVAPKAVAKPAQATKPVELIKPAVEQKAVSVKTEPVKKKSFWARLFGF